MTTPKYMTLTELLTVYGRYRFDNAIEVMRRRVFTRAGDRPDVANIAIVIPYYFQHIQNAMRAKHDGIIMLVIDTFQSDNEIEDLRQMSSTDELGTKCYWTDWFRRDNGTMPVDQMIAVMQNVACQKEQIHRYFKINSLGRKHHVII